MTATAREHEHALILAAQAGDINARNELVMMHRGWCHKQAIYWSQQLRGHEVDDLVHFAVLGLIRAVAGFDASKGFAFLTYASRAIHTEISCHAFTTNSVVYLPVMKRGTSFQTLVRAMRSTSSGNQKDWLDIPEGPCVVETADAIDASDSVAALQTAIESLDPRLASVLRWRMEARTLEAIGNTLGVSKERVRQLERKAENKVRELLTMPKERPRKVTEPYSDKIPTEPRAYWVRDRSSGNEMPAVLDNTRWAIPGIRHQYDGRSMIAYFEFGPAILSATEIHAKEQDT